MVIREYKPEDCDGVFGLFYDTVHAVCVGDYTDEQLFAWASSADSLKLRRGDLLQQRTLIAEICGKIIGFASMDENGCLDLLFVHKNYQRQGIASLLCDELEKDFTVVKTYASITAKLFFERRGYFVIEEREVERSGIKLKNFEMRKQVSR